MSQTEIPLLDSGEGGSIGIGFCQMSLSLKPNIVYPNNPVTAYITVSCPYFTPMGTVMLSINNNTVCQTNLESVGSYTANGSCTFNAPSNPGTYTVYATYAGSGGTVIQPAMLMVNQQPSSGGSTGGGGSSGSSTTSTTTTTPTTSTPPPTTSGISGKTLLEIGLIAVAGAGIASLIVYSMKKR
ncbi:MAG: Ig-like domain-containing protein [Candidatus Nanopusillus acidilobi]